MNGFFVKLKDRMLDTTGAAIALVALTMVVLLSCVALAVDVGMMVTARTEAQVVADGAALEGARMLWKSNGDSASAHAAAMNAGSVDNTVRGENVPILVEDVDVIPSEWTVRVRARRIGARNNAVPTFFARIFGVNEVDITAVAAAWAIESTTVGEDESPTCPALPLAALDRWNENGEEDGWQQGEEIVGFGDEHLGLVSRLKMKPNPTIEVEPDPVMASVDYCEETAGGSSWACWWRTEDESSGAPGVAARILGENCTDPVSTEDVIYSKPGEAQALVLDAFRQVINSDPDLEWCQECAENGCVVEAPSDECFTGNSLRLRTIPIVDPASVAGSGPGNNTFGEVTGFMGVFVERVSETFHGDGDGSPGKQNVYLRLVAQGGTGTGADTPGEDDTGTVKTLQLIE